MAGTHVQYPLPQRSRMHSALLAIAALLCAMAFVAWVSQLSRNDAARELTPPPALAPIDLPASTAIGPGAGIFVEYADGSGGMGCTAGFLVRTATGEAGVLTAGHCNRPGGPGKVTMNLGGVLPYTTVGTFSQTVSEGVHNEQHDIGLVVLGGDDVPRSAAIGTSLPVSGVATNLRIGQELCKFGMGSGEATCGQITEVTKSKVVFLAPGQCGDSGGPVYLNEGDGTVRAVGILIRGGNPNTPKPGCSAPARFSVAELIQPWLDKWRLTTVTTAPSAAG